MTEFFFFRPKMSRMCLFFVVIRCPCAIFKEAVLLDPFDRDTLKAHLLMNGFMDGYTRWIIEDEDDNVEDADGAGNDDTG